MPQPYNVAHVGTRVLTDLDRIPHEKRILQGKKIDHSLRTTEVSNCLTASGEVLKLADRFLCVFPQGSRMLP